MRYLETFLVVGVWIPMLEVIIGVPVMLIGLLMRRQFRTALLVVALNVAIYVLASVLFADGGEKSMDTVIFYWVLGLLMWGSTLVIAVRMCRARLVQRDTQSPTVS